jgi:LPS-assembly protein
LKRFLNYAIVAASLIVGLKDILRNLCWILASMPSLAWTADLICLPSPPPDTRVEEPPVSADPAEPERLEITASQVELSRQDGLDYFGDVRLRYGDRSITAQGATYDRQTGRAEASGAVTYTDPNVSVYGENAEVDTQIEEVFFVNAGFDIPQRPARGSADAIRITNDNVLELSTMRFTTCPMGIDDWELMAENVALDIDEGFGTARGVKLEFKGVPILYTPFLTFPLDDRRKSGFLTPQFSERDRAGLDIRAPYYFNLAPNYDLTIEPRYMALRGLQINTEFRYITQRSDGQLDFDYLHDDHDANIPRHALAFRHRSLLAERWRMLTNLENVSDDAYFEDLGDSQALASQTHLNRFLDFNYRGPYTSMLVRLQGYQTIDTTISEADRPYERVPQILLNGRWAGDLLTFDSTNELVLFERGIGVTGWRLDATEEIGLELDRPGMFLRPTIGVRHTDYWLSDVEPGGDDRLRRTLPIGSVDAGMIFEREAGADGNRIQTLEPRLLYVRIPFEDQSMLPVFDTIAPDFNLVQLFRKYQYVGADRVADSDQVSFGLTTRYIDRKTGRQIFSATVGQTRYLDEQSVMLPGLPPSTADASDYIAEVAASIADAWRLRVDYQWNSETNGRARAEMSVEYAPEAGRLAGFSYRYREGLLEQGDLSLVWPLGERWRVIGRYSYSFLDEEPLDRFLGWEYEACCWRLRVIGRRYISRRSGESDSSISIQLQLKGFNDEGDPPEMLLDRGILGYRQMLN